MDVKTQTQTVTVQIERAPPRRLVQPLRFRPSKIRYDRDVWAMALQPARALIADGYRVVRVRIEWGGIRPGTAEQRNAAARVLTGCYEETCELEVTCGQPGRGSTTIELARRHGETAE